VPPTRSERYALPSAEKSIDKTLAEAKSASFVPGDVSEGDDCSSGGDQCMERQRRQRDAALSAMAPLKSPPLEVVFQPPKDPGEKDVQVDTQVTPATGVVAHSVHDDMFNTWHCGSCTYQNLGKAKGAMTLIRFKQDCHWILGRCLRPIAPSGAYHSINLRCLPPQRPDTQPRMPVTSVLLV